MRLLKPAQNYYARRSTDRRLADHVLIVDDDELVANALRDLFQESGFEASVAYSANEGLTMARKIRPRLLLCDVVMPHKTGIDLMVEIGEALPTCHLIIMTGQSDHLPKVNQQVQKMRNGVWIVLKPFDLKELVHKASPMLRRTRFNAIQAPQYEG
jgi:DNA-binding response OmpR family regulator